MEFDTEPLLFCDGVEGLKSLEVIIGAYRSASQLKRISLPLDEV